MYRILCHTTKLSSDQTGKMYVKFFWWPLIISLVFSAVVTLILNVIIN